MKPVLFAALLLLCSCGAVKKIFRKQTTVSDSTQTVRIQKEAVQIVHTDSSVQHLQTDSSQTITEYERRVVAEDYFLPADSAGRGQQLLVRKTTTYEKGKTREQKATSGHTLKQHHVEANSKLKLDSVGYTAVEKANTVIEQEKEREAYSIFSLQNLLWLLFLVLLFYVARRYLWPRLTDMFQPPHL